MLVLGSGAGGKFLAWHMAKSGHRSAVVERKLTGGSCPNTNCLPSKNEIWSAKVADLVHHADRFGMVTGSVATDMKRVLARKRDMVEGLIAMHLDQYKASGAELIMGTGRFIATKTIEVNLNDGGTRVLTGDRVALISGRMPRSRIFLASPRLRHSPVLRRSSSTDCPTTWWSLAAAMLASSSHKPIAASAAT
jgi:pyruvate/2-oxoglutarate dehydrogenase complex dihydrolipoamide dehydrogenase (E3) component